MRRFTFAILALGVLCVGANAQVLMDQIGANPADLTNFSSTSQDFETANNNFDIAAIDDFTIASSQNVVLVEAGLFGFNGFQSYNNITGYRVEIYSSVAAGAGSLTGDVFSQLFAPGSVSLTTPYNPAVGFATSGLVSVPVNVTLGAGTYWVGVIPVLDFIPNGQQGIAQSTFGGGFPNGLNAFQVNPAGGFGFTGGQAQILSSGAGINLAYRVTAAPVPEPMTLTALAAAFGALALRRRKKS